MRPFSSPDCSRRCIASALAVLITACGGITASRGSTGDPGTGGTSSDGPGGTGAASGDVDGGVGAGAGGTGSNGGEASGRTGSGARGGSTIAGGGTAGGEGSAGNGTNVGGAAGSDPLDPHAAERKQLADGLCSMLESYPCLYYTPQRSSGANPGASTTELVSVCSQDLQVVTFTSGCFAEWAQEMKCLIGLPRQCPCIHESSIRDGCELIVPGLRPNPCPTEEQAVQDCLGKGPTRSGTVSGSHGECNWGKSVTGVCGVNCTENATEFFGTTCDGNPDGPQACHCELNGVLLPDGAPGDYWYGSAFYADNCAGVGQKMADGQCAKILNCCFTWMPAAEAGKPSVQQCSCTSDPTRMGFDTCEAVAAQGGGKVVDLCPQYEYVPTPESFPKP